MTRRYVPHTVRHGAAPMEGEFTHEWEATHTLDRQIARARREMGEARWAELEKEWL